MKTEEPFKKWTAEHHKTAQNDTALAWPSETLIRLFKGSYVPKLDKNYVGKKVLDVGFGNGNNLFFLGTLGLELHGTEVSGEICQAGRERLERYGYAADLRSGTNRSLPYEDNTFDFIVSWNVIHYEDNENDMRSAIAEHQRVLKPGGRIFVSTTAPEHMILKDSERMGKNRYRIGRADDFRKGQIFFYFDSPEDIYYYFGEKFKTILVGRTHDVMLTDTLDWWIVTGVK